jgi:hypothetical protein
MSEPKFTGVWIPAGVFQLTTISLTAKVVYGVVEALDGDDGCFASNAYLSRHLGLEERQIRNILGELTDACLIRREQVNGRRVIRTVEKIALDNAFASASVTKSEPVKELGAATDCHGGRQKIAVGGGKKLPTYNKEDNKEYKDTKAQVSWTVKLPFESDEFSKAWLSWINYRKEIKKPIKESTINAQWKEFAKWGEQKSIIAIQQSILNGWQGLFEPARSVGGNTKTLTSKDHDSF